MKIKYIVVAFLFISLGAGSLSYAQNEVTAGFEIFKDMSKDEIDYAMQKSMEEISKLSEDEQQALLEKTLEDLSKMSDDELNELIQFSEQMFGQEEPANMPQPAEPIAPSLPPAPSPVVESQPDAPEIKELTFDQENLEQTQLMLEELIDTIESILEKSQLKKEFQQSLVTLQDDIGDILYYAYLLKGDKFIEYLFQPEFAGLREQLYTLSAHLSGHNQNFIVQEKSIETPDPYIALGVSPHSSSQEIKTQYNLLLKEKNPAKLLENDPELSMSTAQKQYDLISQSFARIQADKAAHTAFFEILSTFGIALENQKMISQIEQLLKKYEPEALKLKKEQEAQEVIGKQAQESAARAYPSYSPPVFEKPMPPRPELERRGARSGSKPAAPSSTGNNTKTPGLNLPKKNEGDTKKPVEKKKDDSKKKEDEKKKKDQEETKKKKELAEKKKADEKKMLDEHEKIIKKTKEKIVELEKYLAYINQTKFFINFQAYVGQPFTQKDNIDEHIHFITDTTKKLTELATIIKTQLDNELLKANSQQMMLYKLNTKQLWQDLQKKPAMAPIFSAFKSLNIIDKQRVYKSNTPLCLDPSKGYVFFGIVAPGLPDEIISLNKDKKNITQDLKDGIIQLDTIIPETDEKKKKELAEKKKREEQQQAKLTAPQASSVQKISNKEPKLSITPPQDMHLQAKALFDTIETYLTKHADFLNNLPDYLAIPFTDTDTKPIITQQITILETLLEYFAHLMPLVYQQTECKLITTQQELWFTLQHTAKLKPIFDALRTTIEQQIPMNITKRYVFFGTNRQSVNPEWHSYNPNNKNLIGDLYAALQELDAIMPVPENKNLSE